MIALLSSIGTAVAQSGPVATGESPGKPSTRLAIDEIQYSLMVDSEHSSRLVRDPVRDPRAASVVPDIPPAGVELHPAHLSAAPAYARTVLSSRMPVAARSMTSAVGMRMHPILGGMQVHSGIDLAAPSGSPIIATSDGVVSSAGWAGGYGLLVALQHKGGVQTRYAHMSVLNVAQGQQVKSGQVIGYVGSTGRSTGPHLHYEVRVNGQAVNPLQQ